MRDKAKRSMAGGPAGALLLGCAVAVILMRSPVDGAKKYPEIIVDDREKSVLQELVDVNVTLTLNPASSYLLQDSHSIITLNWFQVSVGGFHTCGIRRYFDTKQNKLINGGFDHLNPTDAPGMMKCFGQNKYGQGNVPEMWPNERPTDCPVNEKGFCFDYDDGWRNVSSGWLHTCAIQASGDLYCWGNNRQGEMGGDVPDLVDGSVTCSNDRGDNKDVCRSKLKGKFALVEYGGVAAGKAHSCAIRCNKTPPKSYFEDVYCQNGSLPCKFPGWDTDVQGPVKSCTEGELVCWGSDIFGQISGMNAAIGQQRATEGIYDWISVCAATSHTCAVRKSGSLYCWGHKANGRLDIPQAFKTKSWSAVRCKGAHTCALEQGRQVGNYIRSSMRCWGHNSVGQASVPRYSRQILTPVNDSTVPEVSLLIYDRAFTTFDAGEFNSCALWQQTEDEQRCSFADSKAPALNGGCWGDGTYGQNSLPLRPLEHQASKLCATMQWKIVSTGSYHTCAITFDDSGEYCATENQCSEYPPPLGANGCKGCPIKKCGRGIRRLNQGGGNCVPDRTNHLRCFGLESDGQVKLAIAGAERLVPMMWHAAVSASAALWLLWREAVR